MCNDLRRAFLFADDDGKTVIDLAQAGKAVGTFDVVEEFDGFDGYGGPCRYERADITLDDGRTVAAYRKGKPSGGHYGFVLY